MPRDFIERVRLHLQMHRPRHVIEGFADAAGAVREQDAGAVVVQHHRQIRREPPALREHARRQIAERVDAPARIAPQQ